MEQNTFPVVRYLRNMTVTHLLTSNNTLPDRILSVSNYCSDFSTIRLLASSILEIANVHAVYLQKAKVCFITEEFGILWTSSLDYGSFLPPQIRSSNAHAHPSNWARFLIFGQTLRLFSYFMYANNEGTGETKRMRRFAWAFAGRLYDKYHNLMSWLL